MGSWSYGQKRDVALMADLGWPSKSLLEKKKCPSSVTLPKNMAVEGYSPCLLFDPTLWLNLRTIDLTMFEDVAGTVGVVGAVATWRSSKATTL